jgi:RimJ/RimL family protein N-acetyltransferase
LKPYNLINTIKPEIGEYRLIPLREQDIFNIKEWRNSQLDILRQNHLMTDEEQENYYKNRIKPTFSDPAPEQILFSLLLKNQCIGYGGITNIDWDSKRGELSFLLNPASTADSSLYEKEFSIFITLIKKMAFQGLQLNRIFTETYDIRPFHIAILEKNGFVFEGRLHQHVLIDGRFVDSLIHGFLNEYL